MSHALFAFEDRLAAHRAKEHLLDRGFSAEAIRFHGSAPGPHAPAAAQLDEAATGGFLHNLQNLLDGLFEREAAGSGNGTGGGSSSTELGELIQRGGAVVDIVAHSEAEQRQVEDAMSQTPPSRRTAWQL